MKLTQVEIIKKHIMRKSITQQEAWRLYGISRLASRVWDLKKRGIAVKKRMCEKTGFAIYTKT
jgi:predicted XRE-type DNA-binding protein